MNKFRVSFIFLIGLLIASVKVESRRSGPPEHDVPSGTVRAAQQRERAAQAARAAQQAELARTIRAVEAARLEAFQQRRQSILLIRDRFRVPATALGQFSAYPANQHANLFAQLQNDRTRFVHVADQNNGEFALYATLARLEDGGVSLLTFRVYQQGGRVVLVGIARVHRQVPEGRNFVQRVIAEANANWTTLQRDFGSLHVVEPV